MKHTIRLQLNKYFEEERVLYKLVTKLDEYNECCTCDECEKFEFSRTVCGMDNNVLCLNCGGYVEDMD